MKQGRRSLLKAGVGFMALGSLSGISGCSLLSKTLKLKSDPAGILDLPPGFTYKVLQKKGEMMSDGYPVPGKPDGMASFLATNGSIVLMRNHELDAREPEFSPVLYERNKELFYNKQGAGCVTRVEINPVSLEVLSSNLVLAGTLRNCAGGISPWGWVSCEEAVGGLHGYAFLCSPDVLRLSSPNKLASLGKFYHEAFAFNPETGISYLTEDREDGCLYRFMPEHKDQPFGNGRLQALRVQSYPQMDTAKGMLHDIDLDVDWVTIDNPEPEPEDDSCRYQGRDKGAAIISRGEGIWFYGGEIFFSSTNGGIRGKGQIFRLSHLGQKVNQLKLIYESDGWRGLESPDNIAVSPRGNLVIAEDGSGHDYLWLMNREGKAVVMAKNSLSESEVTGVNFSSDGRLLFLNIQEQGLTLVISGSFDEYIDQA
ncbi:hypothetical protein ACH42_06735 [Endozoicomonas sp. (ex Bugula neritina AB1)]|nr:hypothetical protein ACH42_06735 [Endozoicomonas sp. (ex Bugula neritina AB1)]